MNAISPASAPTRYCQYKCVPGPYGARCTRNYIAHNCAVSKAAEPERITGNATTTGGLKAAGQHSVYPNWRITQPRRRLSVAYAQTVSMNPSHMLNSARPRLLEIHTHVTNTVQLLPPFATGPVQFWPTRVRVQHDSYIRANRAAVWQLMQVSSGTAAGCCMPGSLHCSRVHSGLLELYSLQPQT